jgi:hypothetical protein
MGNRWRVRGNTIYNLLTEQKLEHRNWRVPRSLHAKENV